MKTNLSLLVEDVQDLLLFLDELLCLGGVVAVDVPGGEHPLLCQPFHVRRQLVRVLNKEYILH